jgi:hypothetical protein
MTTRNRQAPTTHRLILLVAATALAILAVGCASASTPSPSSPPSAPPTASTPPSGSPVTTPEAAAARALASDARFTGLQPLNADMIGQCCFYEVTPKGEDFTVKIEIGWGDCQAGCINRHHWNYTVTKAGVVTFDGEDGPAVPAGVPGSGGTTGTGTGGGADGIRATAHAGPTCPVVTANDPNCGDRPVVGATVHVTDATGVEVAQMTTDAAGTFTVDLPPGRYQLSADPADGLMGVPSPVDVVVGAGLAIVDLAYDTGIR